MPGNHDQNYESPYDKYATSTYSRYYGPTEFSFNHGDVHFIGADNIDNGDVDRPDQGCVFNERQLQWLKNDLKFVPRNKLIVPITHCPLITYALDGNGQRYALGGNINTINFAALVEILKPFRRVYWIAGHDTSNSWKVQLNHTHNWHGEWFMSHTLAEVRGNGWSTGPRTERDTRTVNMQDGNPNGYYVMTFKGTTVKPKFIPGKGDPNQSMRIVLDPLPLGTREQGTGKVLAINRGPLAPNTKVIVNLFDGGDQDVVKLSLDGGPWTKLKNVLRNDPFQDRQYLQYRGTDSAVGRPEPSSHIWEYPLSADLAPGVHTVEVTTRDNFGQVAEDSFSFEVLAATPAQVQTLSAERASDAQDLDRQGDADSRLSRGGPCPHSFMRTRWLIVAAAFGSCLLRSASGGAENAAADAEFRVNTVTGKIQQSSSVAMGPRGDFVVAWQSEIDGSGDEIRARRFDACGVAQGEEFAVNALSEGNQNAPSLAMDAAGLASWSSGKASSPTTT